jgi:uncharacterized protein (TIGR00661 family)
MKYLFVVQGEGRGHFTQALSLKSMLERNGHEVVAVMVGCSAQRTLPGFFTDKIKTEVIRFQSPNFLPSPKGKKTFLLASILYNLLLVPAYIASLLRIQSTIAKMKPDVVINFYELLCGMTYGVFNPKVPMINVAHQYYFLTPDFRYTGENKTQFKLLNFYSRLTALNSQRMLALSFRIQDQSYFGKIAIVPPLLRREIINRKAEKGNYIHGYMLNNGYVKELVRWTEFNLREQLHFFWDKKNANTTTSLTNGLTMHSLDDTLFLEYMAGCKGYATTAGFESVCEAMYLQKPVLMVPTHIEQECNAIDAMRSNAGVTADFFNLNILLDFIPTYQRTLEFRYWIHTAESIFMYELTRFETEESTILAAM